MTDNTITDNTITDNTITDNTITDNTITKSGQKDTIVLMRSPQEKQTIQ